MQAQLRAGTVRQVKGRGIASVVVLVVVLAGCTTGGEETRDTLTPPDERGSSSTGTTDSTTNGGEEGAPPANASEFLLTQPEMGVCEAVDAPQGGTFVIDGIGSAVVTLGDDGIEVGEATDGEDWRSYVRTWAPAGAVGSGDWVEITWQDGLGTGPTDLWLYMRLFGDTLNVSLCGGI